MLENDSVGTKRFAVVDLEASSTKPRNRIIEVAVLILEDDGSEVSLKETFSTLVNPELKVPNDILELTGITEEELEAAPKFFELAEDLELLTRDCTIVAHNVEFDIGLLQEEFEKLGTDYPRKTKCTLKLSKETYPELAGYDLKSLCELLDISLTFNHRAMDDAVACAELFVKTYFKSHASTQDESPSWTKLHKSHPGLDLNFIAELQATPGLVHFNKDGTTVFIERFENLKTDVPRFLLRFIERFDTDIDHIQILSYKDSLLAMRKKEERIGKLQPKFNIDERGKSWGVYLAQNPFSLRAFPLSKGKGDLLFISPNKEEALHWIRLQLSDVEKQEFAYIDQQDQKLINRLKKEREKTIKTKIKPFSSYPHDHFVVMGPGRDDDELSCHFFAGGRLSGHAFLSGQAVYTLDSAPKNLKPLRESDLLKHYFLREFQDWKSRSRKDHSIKVLKSNKSKDKSARKAAAGNRGDSPSSPGAGKKKHHSRSKKKKKPFRKKSNSGNRGNGNANGNTSSSHQG
jgi:DNA polymerase-3 subunit epsilon